MGVDITTSFAQVFVGHLAIGYTGSSRTTYMCYSTLRDETPLRADSGAPGSSQGEESDEVSRAMGDLAVRGL
jgi:hypothetical protein